MKILVTGAAGFLGVRLIDALLQRDHGRPEAGAIVAADVARCPIAVRTRFFSG